MNRQQIMKVKQLARPLFTVLIVLMIFFNIYAMLDTIAKNRQTRQVNVKLEKQIEQAEELQLKNEEVYLQNVEDIKRLDDLINRFHLQLDQLERR